MPVPKNIIYMCMYTVVVVVDLLCVCFQIENENELFGIFPVRALISETGSLNEVAK